MLRNFSLSFLIGGLTVFLFLLACKKIIMEHRPVANAGPADTLTLPVDSVRLMGSGSSPNGTIAAYEWRQLTGPNNATIANPTAPSTIVTGLVEGTYTFQLTVTDNFAIPASDTTTVLVNPAPYQILISQPADNPYEMMLSTRCNCPIPSFDSSGLTTESFAAKFGSLGGRFWMVRGLVKFIDLNTIPSSDTILSAHLYLYSNPEPGPFSGDGIHANTGYPNGLALSKPSKDWSPDTTNLYNQTPNWGGGVIRISTSIYPFEDIDVDVTPLVRQMVNGNQNYGFLLQLWNEAGGSPDYPTSPSRVFVASHNHKYPGKHPKLVVKYK